MVDQIKLKSQIILGLYMEICQELESHGTSSIRTFLKQISDIYLFISVSQKREQNYKCPIA